MRSASTRRYLTFIATNVRDLRARAALTQEQLAERAEVDVTYLQRIECGKVNLSVRILVALADALEVGPERLLREAELKPPTYGRPRKTKPLMSRDSAPDLLHRWGAAHPSPLLT